MRGRESITWAGSGRGKEKGVCQATAQERECSPLVIPGERSETRDPERKQTRRTRQARPPAQPLSRSRLSASLRPG